MRVVAGDVAAVGPDAGAAVGVPLVVAVLRPVLGDGDEQYQGCWTGESFATQPVIGTVTTVDVPCAFAALTVASSDLSASSTWFSKYQSAPRLVVLLVQL